jgi:hypothetical protein
MTKADLIEVLDKYDSDFNLETGETIQAIYFYDFGKLADELVKLFAIYNVRQQRELLIAYENSRGDIIGNRSKPDTTYSEDWDELAYGSVGKKVYHINSDAETKPNDVITLNGINYKRIDE